MKLFQKNSNVFKSLVILLSLSGSVSAAAIGGGSFGGDFKLYEEPRSWASQCADAVNTTLITVCDFAFDVILDDPFFATELGNSDIISPFPDDGDDGPTCDPLSQEDLEFALDLFTDRPGNGGNPTPLCDVLDELEDDGFCVDPWQGVGGTMRALDEYENLDNPPFDFCEYLGMANGVSFCLDDETIESFCNPTPPTHEQWLDMQYGGGIY